MKHFQQYSQFSIFYSKKTKQIQKNTDGSHSLNHFILILLSDCHNLLPKWNKSSKTDWTLYQCNKLSNSTDWRSNQWRKLRISDYVKLLLFCWCFYQTIQIKEYKHYVTILWNGNRNSSSTLNQQTQQQKEIHKQIVTAIMTVVWCDDALIIHINN